MSQYELRVKYTPYSGLFCIQGLSSKSGQALNTKYIWIYIYLDSHGLAECLD